jgi:hypothetical protein
MGAKWLATCKSNGKGTNAASKKHADLIQSSAAALEAFINARFPSILPSESHAVLPGGLRTKRFDSISFSEFLLNALHEDGNDYGTSILLEGLQVKDPPVGGGGGQTAVSVLCAGDRIGSTHCRWPHNRHGSKELDAWYGGPARFERDY